MRSFSALALGLTLVDLSAARVANNGRSVEQRNTNNGVLSWFNRIFRKDVDETVERRQDDGTCYIDSYYNFVHNSSFGEDFCRSFMNYPEVTTTDDYTPVSTSVYYYTTQSGVQRSTTTVTPVTTVTATVGGNAKRDAAPEPTIAPRDIDVVNRMLRQFQQARADNGSESVSDPAISASFSSACGCQTYGGLTTTVTSTHSPVIFTQSAFTRTTATIVTTRTAPLSTITVSGSPATSDVTSSPAEEPPAPSSVEPTGTGPVPTSPVFSCPKDNNAIVDQMVGNQRYNYRVLCDTDIMDPDSFDDLHYVTYSECMAACSAADAGLNGAVCQGFTFYDTPNAAGSNCFLKQTTNVTQPATGIDSAILQEMVVGVSGDEPEGTNTETAPFDPAPTPNPSDISSILSGSSSTISVSTITPPPQIAPSGRLGQGEITSYSTYVSDGTTFSTGTVFYTSYTMSGSWYWSYYTSYSQAWTSAATVYGYSEGGTEVTNATTSGSEQQSNGDGSYTIITTTNSTSYFPGGYNVTQVIGNGTYAANGTQISSTATTYYSTYQTGAAGGGSGSGALSNGAGPITSPYPGSSWSSVIVTSGGTGFASGAFGSGAIASQTPTPISSFVTSGGTAYSSGGFGQGGATGGQSSAQGSGGLGSPSPVSSTVVSFQTGGQFGTGGSGPIPISSTVTSGQTQGESQTGGSGPIPSSPSFSPISSTIVSSATAGESQAAGSGGIPSSGSPFTNTNGLRSGTGSTTLPPGTAVSVSSTSGNTIFESSTGGLGAPSSVLPIPSNGSVTSTAFATGLASSTGGYGALPSSGSPFTNSERPRSGTLSTTRPASSGFPAPSGSFSAPSPYSPSGSAPLSTAPTSSGQVIYSQSVPFPPYGNFPPPSSSAPGFTNSQGSRSGTQRPSSSFPTAPLATGSSSVPLLTGTAPTPSFGQGYGPTGVGFTNSQGSRSGTQRPSSSFPTVPTAPLNTAPSSGFVPTGTAPGTSPAPSSAFPPYPTGPSSCVTNYFGTTTIFTTVTEYGCYSNCPPQGGYGGSPLTFGPPSFAQPSQRSQYNDA